MTNDVPDHEAMREAVAFSTRAPSLHNVQPWRWEIRDHSLHLVLDRSRPLPATDPADRELVFSCGAALHHAALALTVLGRRTRIRRMPERATTDLLATIEPAGHAEPSEAAVALLRAAYGRQADRRRYAAEPVPAATLEQLVRAGTGADVSILVAEHDDRYAVARAFAKAAFLHGYSAQYRDELAAWTALDSSSDTGVPATSTPHPGLRYGDLVLRDFGRVAIAQEEAGSARTAGSILLVSTEDDDARAHLAVGEATSIVLCTATFHGLASCPLSEAFEIDSTRDALRREVFAGSRHPQIAMRVGWPPDPRNPPLTPRRPVRELLRDLTEERS
ncbi:NAD(P)H nitroreductase [Saccharopolyspora gloriosae]|uniref:Nitroreductase n=1 Tax=Saccharopolyspora gloriosae TaxID=455344 RepID=A0A840NP38_9PSEU|nr:nitroreductase family protein [Saccharopolyspora gloriosae]MBB5070017.1 nitroreductase [Saccharopolyspora gloriosae]